MQEAKLSVPLHEEGTEPVRVEAPVKVKMVRDYSQGSLVERISRCEDPQQLAAIHDEVTGLVKRKRLSLRTMKRVNAAGLAKRREFEMRLVQPAKEGLLLPPGARVPKGALYAPGGIIQP